MPQPKPARRGHRGRRRTVALGLHRALGVRIAMTEHGPLAAVVAVVHRRPVVQRISLTTATELAAAGVPVLVHPQAPLPSRRPPQAAPTATGTGSR